MKISSTAAALFAWAVALGGAASTGAAAGSGPAMTRSDCGNFFGQRCLVSLPTGIHMSYFDAGTTTGEILILLHTDTTSAVEWAWTVDALLRINPELHIYALDQRGAGATDLPERAVCRSSPNLCMTQADLAADLLAFMDARKIAKATLVGHAMGAAAARAVALEHPERVARLILTGTGVSPAAAPPRPESPPPAFHVLDALGWQKMLQNRHVAWPQGALHMRPLDIDPDAVRHITQHWDISAIAAPEMVDLIAAQTAMESLATWGVLDPTPIPAEAPVRLDKLQVPTLVLWGSEDAGLDRASQQRVIDQLTQASRAHPGMYFYWKQYGVRPPPASGNKHDADDIGHNLSWEAPRQLAADIDSFVRAGEPTRDLYRSDAPRRIQTILEERGKAIIVSSRPR
jgi:pimeloyl-ACP methyl ester carboxylesterase